MLDKGERGLYINLLQENRSHTKPIFYVCNKLLIKKIKKKYHYHLEQLMSFPPTSMTSSSTKLLRYGQILQSTTRSTTRKMKVQPSHHKLSNFTALSEKNVSKLVLHSPRKSCESGPLSTYLLKSTLLPIPPVMTYAVNA